MSDTKRRLIGNSTRIIFPELYLADIPARVDTGARLSSVWASAEEEDGRLKVVFFGKDSPLYTGVPVYFGSYEQLVVASSMGHTQRRYVVKLLVSIGGKKIRASFTLANRSSQVYPILIGRNVLRGKFIVDVKVGKSLRDQELTHRKHLQDSGREENV